MISPIATACPPNAPPTSPFNTPGWRWFALCVAVLCLAWGSTLLEVGRLGLKEDMHSHVFLIPLVSAYLVWTEQRKMPAPGAPSWVGVGVLGGLAVVGVAFGMGLAGLGGTAVAGDVRLAARVIALWLAVAAVMAGTLGSRVLGFCAFPLAFLIFSVPLPQGAVDAMETGLKYASADASHWMMDITRLPVLREGLFFQMPGLTIEVAQECSGIRSSWVLLIVGVLAARMFLVTPWKRALLIAFVVPLGIVRNGFRIWSLSYLSVNVDPEIIHSWVHHKGGPIFFALSLIPFALLLWILSRSEPSGAEVAPTVSPSSPS